jgi:hypothetical protein
MADLQALLTARKVDLVGACKTLATLKLNNVEAIRKCDAFISSATSEAAYGDGLAFFGQMRDAGKVIPKEFEQLDLNPHVKNEDRRVQPYIRSQLFIALVAELEDYLSSLLILVLEAHPDKVRDRPMTFGEVLDLGTIEGVISDAVRAEIHGLFYKKPLEYRKRIEQILMMPTLVLDPHWVQFVELKARRDVGMHGNWHQNETYSRKLSEVGGAPGPKKFLGVDSSYFGQALVLGEDLIRACNKHCQVRFSVT